MAPATPRFVVPIDLKKNPWEQNAPLHNRWHPHIPHVATVNTGEVFRVEMVDWTGGAIKDNDSALDIKFLDLSTVSINVITTVMWMLEIEFFTQLLYEFCSYTN